MVLLESVIDGDSMVECYVQGIALRRGINSQ